jgi:hypothetical protein
MQVLVKAAVQIEPLATCNVPTYSDNVFNVNYR